MALITFSPNTKIKSADINSNFAGLVDGSLLGSNAINTSNIVANAVTKGTNVFAVTCSSQSISAAAGMTNITGASGSVTTTGGDLLIMLSLSSYKDTNAGRVLARLSIDSGSSFWPNGTGYYFFINTLQEHNSFTWTGILSGLSAATHTFQLQMQAANNNVLVNSDDYELLTVVELKK